jgi:(S)-ureidoglycine aminohydrolase
MATPPYASPLGGLPPQAALHTQRAVFTEAYALIPRGVMRDIVTSYLPHWTETRAWIIARPMTGFAETFSQYVMEVFPGGGSTQPEPDSGVEGVIFVVSGHATLTIDGKSHALRPGGYAYLPPGCA